MLHHCKCGQEAINIPNVRPALFWTWSLSTVRVAPITAALVLVEAKAGVEVGRHALET